MDLINISILETILILSLYAGSFFVIKNTINNSLKKTRLERTRRKFIIRAMQLFTTITVVVVVAGIWGLEQNKIAVFVSTLLTALGIAFFAQWSLLSNITSSIVLFFNHPMKLGDTIKILDKDCPFEGEVTELTYFYVHLKTTNGEIITIPNALLLQKAIVVVVNKNDI